MLCPEVLARILPVMKERGFISLPLLATERGIAVG
jgi:acetolactate synthase regulatory subunit